MDLQDRLNQAYQAKEYLGQEKDVNSSLLEFLSLQLIEDLLGDTRRGRALELGCGDKGLLEVWPSKDCPGFLEMEGIDLSDYALGLAAKLQGRVEYKLADISEDDLGLNRYDLIIDGHCLHTLSSQQKLEQSLKSIFRGLAPGGLLVWETMITHKGLKMGEGWSYNEWSRSYHNSRNGSSRLIFSTFQIEKLLLSVGLQIQYFYILSHQRFIPDDQRQQALPTDPELLRIIAKKGK
jgi:SAM-dependent methyltransferase